MRDTGLDQTADLARDLQIEIIDHQGSSIGAPARELRLIRHATKRSVPTRSITSLAIIDPPLWDAVQGQLGSNTAERNSATGLGHPSFHR
jgi:hypothetical protein